ncbi:chemotaxis protein CheW [Paenibacillus sp. J5C_2022]|uniref:chemotaxis protein CheW n=1 Tax=Paenibacillus sp. J5C2022 TaxID=2977129 RepID=UPI0021D24340|nr:chemotaxis protein CheW [Paenibacillus sp. J5C2022]MCU6710631.1 chemotaxis protein CheW [Paenibacillus sp. J5C2022]
MSEGNGGKYVEVGIQSERYAIAIQDIHEIIKVQQMTEIPNSRSYLLGVINLRGSIVPVVSLRMRLGLSEAEPTPASRIVIVNDGGEAVGLMVDRVYQVIAIGNMQAPPERSGSASGRLLDGIAREEGRLISLLKLGPVLDSDCSNR